MADHLSMGSVTCARLARARPKIESIQEYFQESEGTLSSPPRLLVSSCACRKISRRSGYSLRIGDSTLSIPSRIGSRCWPAKLDRKIRHHHRLEAWCPMDRPLQRARD